jgi:hypothetical protein
MTQHADAIWKLADAQRDRFTQHNVGGRLFSFDLTGFIGHCKEHGIPIGSEELLFILSRLDMGTFDSPFIPGSVATFMAMLAEPYSPRSVLDPWAGLGVLACAVQNICFHRNSTLIPSTQRNMRSLAFCLKRRRLTWYSRTDESPSRK